MTACVLRMVIEVYRRTLTRLTPQCPSTPSCSAYAVAALREHGAREGLQKAADYIRTCRVPSGHDTDAV